MQMRTLGKDGLLVSVIGLGFMLLFSMRMIEPSVIKSVAWTESTLLSRKIYFYHRTRNIHWMERGPPGWYSEPV